MRGDATVWIDSFESLYRSIGCLQRYVLCESRRSSSVVAEQATVSGDLIGDFAPDRVSVRGSEPLSDLDTLHQGRAADKVVLAVQPVFDKSLALSACRAVL